MATPVLPRPKYPVIDNDPDVRTVIGSFGLGEVVFIGAAAIGTGMLGYTIGAPYRNSTAKVLTAIGGLGGLTASYQQSLKKLKGYFPS